MIFVEEDGFEPTVFRVSGGRSYRAELFLCVSVKAYAFDFDRDLFAAPFAPEIDRAPAYDVFVSSEDFWGSPESDTART